MTKESMQNPTTLPPNPFIGGDDAEDTANSINAVLAFIQADEIGQKDILQHSAPVDTQRVTGLLRILDGLRDAVKYLSELEAVPSSNVTKLEVES